MANGKPAKLVDTSNDARYTAGEITLDTQGRRLGDQAFLDMTDKQNDEVSAACLPPFFLLLPVRWLMRFVIRQFVYTY